MADQTAAIDANSKAALTAVSSGDGTTIVRLYANPTTHRLLTDAGLTPATATTWGSTGNTSVITDAAITTASLIVFSCATPPTGLWGVAYSNGSATITSSDSENGTLAFTYKVFA